MTQFKQGKRYNAVQGARKNLRRSYLLFAAAAAALCSTRLSLAQVETDWIAASGNWSSSGNWDNGVPGNGYLVYLSYSIPLPPTVTYDYAGSSVTLEQLVVDDTSSSIDVPENGPGPAMLSIPANSLSCELEFIGANGFGTTTQSGGINATQQLMLGYYAGAFGSYALSGTGLLSDSGYDEAVGYSGVGEFSQTGGTNTVGSSNSLFLGTNSGSIGYYDLSGSGVLSVDNSEVIGYSGNGSFNQAGGTNTIGQSLYIASQSGSSGGYMLSGGTVDVSGNVDIGNGTGGLTITGTGILNIGGNLVDASALGTSIILSGGTIATGSLDLNSGSSTLNWTSGTLNLTNSSLIIGSGGVLGSSLTLASGQTLEVTGSGYALNITSNGTLNLNGGTINTTSLTNTGQFNWTSGTLNLTDSNFTVGEGGLLGSTLTLVSGQLLGVTGYNNTLTISNSGTLNLYGGTVSTSSLNNSGQFNWTSGTLDLTNEAVIIDNTSAGNLGDSASPAGSFVLSAGQSLQVDGNYEYVGYSGTGSFNQSGGTNTINGGSGLAVGALSGAVATYTLSGGSLSINGGYEFVASHGSIGTFDQSGGTNSALSLYVGPSVGSTGTFNLSGTGSLSVSDAEYIGYDGTGTFIETNGTNTINGTGGLVLGVDSGSTGTYTLSGGLLSVSGNYEVVGNSGAGSFNQSGGTNTINGGSGLNVGSSSGVIATYTLSGGSLSINGGYEFVL
jgi:fibronectin-binding autotransporter adhesin